MSDLETQRCLPCEGNLPALTAQEVIQQLATLPGAWQTNHEYTAIYRIFEFKNYYHTIAFVNAVAWITHHENHHPDLEVSYNRCLVRYQTHAIQGLTRNDFICATKIEKIFNCL